jgi:hypothetical protein
MAKYELVKETEINGKVWYHITKDELHVNESWTRSLEEASELFNELAKGKPSEKIIEIIKTIETDEN